MEYKFTLMYSTLRMIDSPDDLPYKGYVVELPFLEAYGESPLHVEKKLIIMIEEFMKNGHKEEITITADNGW